MTNHVRLKTATNLILELFFFKSEKHIHPTLWKVR